VLRHHPHCVLVVEDNPDTRQAIMLLLELEGFDVAGAGDGQEALQCARSFPRLCLILLDVNMPRMDGVTFRREQLGDPRIRDIAVVVLSALPRHHPMLGPLVELEMFQKPIDPERLVMLVEKYCAAHDGEIAVV